MRLRSLATAGPDDVEQLWQPVVDGHRHVVLLVVVRAQFRPVREVQQLVNRDEAPPFGADREPPARPSIPLSAGTELLGLSCLLSGQRRWPLVLLATSLGQRRWNLAVVSGEATTDMQEGNRRPRKREEDAEAPTAASLRAAKKAPR
jgi:hypothetical protein